MSDDLDFEMEVVESSELNSSASSDEDKDTTGRESRKTSGPRTETETNTRREKKSGSTLRSLPDDWEVNKLGFDFEIEYGDEKRPQELDDDEGYPLYGANGVIGRSNEYLFEDPVVTVTCRGATCGNVHLTDPNSWVTNNSLVLQKKSEVNNYFLANALRYHSVERAITGSAQPQITSGMLGKMEYPAPDLPEQRKIASVLYTVDQAIQKTEGIIERAKRVRRGVEQNLLTYGVLKDGTHRPERRVENKSSWVGEVPEEWEVYDYGDLVQDSSVGIVVKPSQYYDESGTVPILRSKDISRDGIENGDFKYMTEDANEENSNSKLNEGNVITVRSGDPGLSCVVSSDYDGANCADLLISTPGTDLVPNYASLWINSYAGKRQIDRFQAGLAQKHFNLGALRKLRIPLPTVEEQKRIVEIEGRITAQIAKEVEIHNRLERLKKGIMQDLLTGEVRTADRAIDVLEEVQAHG